MPAGRIADGPPPTLSPHLTEPMLARTIYWLAATVALAPTLGLLWAAYDGERDLLVGATLVLNAALVFVARRTLAAASVKTPARDVAGHNTEGSTARHRPRADREPPETLLQSAILGAGVGFGLGVVLCAAHFLALYVE